MASPSFVVLDVETTGLSFMTDRLHGIGWMEEGQTRATYSLSEFIPVRLRELLADPQVAKVGHNLHAFDAKFIRRAGYEINGEFDDTMVIWNLVDSDSPLGLKWLTSEVLGKPENLERKRFLDRLISYLGLKNIADLCRFDIESNHSFYTLDGISVTATIADYCQEDVENTQELFVRGMEKLGVLDGKIKAWGHPKSPLDYYNEEARPLERVLFEIEMRGIRLDLKAVDKLKSEAQIRIDCNLSELNRMCARPIAAVEESLYRKKLASLKTEKGRAKVKRGTGKLRFSWQNNGHVANLLFKECGLERFAKKTDKGSLKLDKVGLEEMEKSPELPKNIKKVLRLFLEYKKWNKLLSTYAGDEERGILSRAVRLPNGEARIFPTYMQTSGTGRLKCSNPNMQNLPRDAEVKRFFVPDSEDEVFDDADYSQIELRVAAHESGDKALIDSYLNEAMTGQDTHCLTASRTFGRPIFKKDCKEGSEEAVMRQVGKTQNFLTIYKGSAFRLQQSLLAATGREWSIEECREMIDTWFETYPEVGRYLERQKLMFERFHCVIAANGRMRRLPDIRFKPDGYKAPWNMDNPLTSELLTKWREANPKEKRTPDPDELGQFAYRLYSHAIKAGYNQPIQSVAASLAKRAMIKLHREGHRIANQVHDNLVVARPRSDSAARARFVAVMEGIAKLRVPLKADVKTLRSFHPADKAS